LIATSAFYRQHVFEEHSSLPANSLLIAVVVLPQSQSNVNIDIIFWKYDGVFDPH